MEQLRNLALDCPVDRTPWRRRHHPWRVFGTRFSDWKLEWTNELPVGRWGLTLHDEKRVLVADHLDEAERRCTIAHETQHIIRGPVADGQHAYLREEHEINRRTSRLLTPSIRRVGQALAAHHADHELAAWELWVDEDTFAARLSTLEPRDRAWLDDQLASVWVA